MGKSLCQKCRKSGDCKVEKIFLEFVKKPKVKCKVISCLGFKKLKKRKLRKFFKKVWIAIVITLIAILGAISQWTLKLSNKLKEGLK